LEGKLQINSGKVVEMLFLKNLTPQELEISLKMLFCFVLFCSFVFLSQNLFQYFFRQELSSIKYRRLLNRESFHERQGNQK